MKDCKIKRLKNPLSCFAIALCTMLYSGLPGCSSTNEITEIKPRVIQPETIEDTLEVIEKTDSVIVGVDIISDRTGTGKTDSVILVKYFPKTEKFYIRVKPDSIVLWDTVKTYQTIEKIVETPFLAKTGLVLIGIILAAAGIFFFKK